MRVRNVLIVSLLVAVAALAAIAFLSSGGDRTRNDAQLFLSRFGSLDIDDPPSERTALLTGLAQLPFASPEVREIRDLCVEAHQSLLVAEARGVEARELFDSATDRGRIVESEIPVDVRASIEAALQESNQALARVRPLMGECDDRVRGLRARYAARRRTSH